MSASWRSPGTGGGPGDPEIVATRTRSPSTRQAVPTMHSPHPSRRSFVKTSVALAGGLNRADAGKAAGPLLAYVGTFSSPLRDVLPTQVDLPPGNGRGIHLLMALMPPQPDRLISP